MPQTYLQWIEAYRAAWLQKDVESVAELFTEDGRYLSSPFRPASVGRAAIKEYWRAATQTQQDLRLEFGELFVDGDHVVVEWWATMRDAGWAAVSGASDDRVTLPGCLILRFNEQGLCEELREYWHAEFGPLRNPPEGWGR